MFSNIIARKRDLMKQELLNKYNDRSLYLDLTPKNLYVLDYNNKLLKKSLKNNNIYSGLYVLYVDIALYIATIAINLILCKQLYDFVPNSSLALCSACWFFYAIYDFYRVYKESDIIDSTEKTMIIKKDSSIIFVKPKADMYITPMTAASAIGLNSSSNNIVASLFFMSLINHSQKKLNDSQMEEYKKNMENEISNISNNKLANYVFKRYDDCKLIKETKKYYLYSGNTCIVKNGITNIEKQNFKLYKVYINADNLLNGGEK